MMTRRIVPPPSTQVRNQSMECFKMVASIVVLFLHVSVPGKTQSLLQLLANDAVALFFAITGYFNFGADQKTLARRLKHLLRL